MTPRPNRQQPPAVDPEHLRTTLADALELARRTPGALADALRELRLSVLELEEPRLAELLRRKRRARA